MNRNELETALAALEKPNVAAMRVPISTIKEYRRIVNAAARRWLDLQPEECGTCEGSGTVYERIDATHDAADQCPKCRNGYVYKMETVERIAKALCDATTTPRNTRGHPLWDYHLGQAVAVLDALNEEKP